jgi:hypothetical protein
MVYTTESFIQKAIEIYEDKYNYSKVNYINSKTKIIIICKIHNAFEQVPSDHLRGNGCRKCKIAKGKSNTNSFIERSIKTHGNKYDYSKANYIKSNEKIMIICHYHGEINK